MQAHTGKKIQEQLTQLRNDLLGKYPPRGDSARRNELSNHLDVSIRFFAERFDRGLEIEVRLPKEREKEILQKTVAAQKETEEGQVPKVPEGISDEERMIMESTKLRSILERSPEPVLQLPPTKPEKTLVVEEDEEAEQLEKEGKSIKIKIKKS